MRFASRAAHVLLWALCTVSIARADVSVLDPGDPHYTPAGFFDMHVCNWTDRPMFFLAVFSTERFAEVKSVELLRPNGQPLMQMDLRRYRAIKRANKPEKRAFIEQFPLPPDAADGWYSARVVLQSGAQYVARDYIVIHTMPPATGLTPAPGAERIPVPVALSWNPVPGATHYKIFIRDLWDDGKLIHESALLTAPRFDLPPGLIKPGGVYSWRVHARDVDGNVLLGDFNHGSFTGETEFSTAD